MRSTSTQLWRSEKIKEQMEKGRKRAGKAKGVEGKGRGAEKAKGKGQRKERK